MAPSQSKWKSKVNVLLILGAGLSPVSCHNYLDNSSKPIRETQLRCNIDGKTIDLSRSVKAGYSEEGGIYILSFSSLIKNPRQFTLVSLNIPKETTGRFTIRNTPKLRLDYSRNLFSSYSDDHFTAFADLPGSKLHITITDSGAKSGWLMGRFSAKAVTLPAKSVSITDGVFCVRLNQQAEDENSPSKKLEHLLQDSLPSDTFQFAFRITPPRRNITDFTLRFDLD